MQVSVFVTLRGRLVPIDQVSDKRMVASFRQAGVELGNKLDTIHCPTHQRGPKDVRLQFSERGEAELKYDSCCDELPKAVQKALG